MDHSWSLSLQERAPQTTSISILGFVQNQCQTTDESTRQQNITKFHFLLIEMLAKKEDVLMFCVDNLLPVVVR